MDWDPVEIGRCCLILALMTVVGLILAALVLGYPLLMLFDVLTG